MSENIERPEDNWIIRAFEQESRFWSHVKKSDGCWTWLLSTDKDGYGKFQVNLPRLNGRQQQKHVRAHRMAFMFKTGSPAKGLVLHSCDNPLCCNPDHLEDGSQAKNRADCKARGRVAKGEQHGSAKLSEQQAIEIIRRRAAGEKPKELARAFGIGYSSVFQIGTHYWKHLATSP